MPQIVVTCHTDGSLETILKDKVFDTRDLGDRTVERLSSVEFSKGKQKFYIKWLKGPRANNIERLDTLTATAGINPIKFFDTYEDAVTHEIDQVNAMRLAGHSFV